MSIVARGARLLVWGFIAVLGGAASGQWFETVEGTGKEPSVGTMDVEDEDALFMSAADGGVDRTATGGGDGDEGLCPALDAAYAFSPFSFSVGALNDDGLLDLVIADDGPDDSPLDQETPQRVADCGRRRDQGWSRSRAR